MVTPVNSSVELQISKLLASISEYKASDLHFSVGNPPTLRVGGKLVPLTSEELLTPEFIQSLIDGILPAELVPELDLHRDITFTYATKGKARYKVHAYYQQGYVSITFRLIPMTIPPLVNLDVPEPVKNIVQFQDGLIIVAGAYGAGKTTVLASCLEYYNQTFSKHIVTFERPIEILFTDAKSIIEQREVGRDIPNAAAVKDFAAQEDVDIIMIANVDNGDVLQAALHTAQMGKLVFIEVTAQSIQYTLERLIELVPHEDEAHVRSSLASCLRAVVALQAMPNNAGAVSLAAEVLLSGPGVTNMLRQDSFDKVNVILENGTAEGMLSFQQSINWLIQNGQISPRM